ncbi:MAG: 2-hydroxyacyl-CoA dehydratase, partial [Candidatus Helarchaeota archaeon]|nr:2-hydroxyacyl-CoA dehydratase [Candidatus Helarchaeota archaeon]
MISYINKILDKKSSRINEIIKEKTSGKKVLGWLCTYTPEELVHAAGIIPYRIFKGGEEEPTTTADTYLQRNLCPFARACMGYALMGYYDFLDGVASTHTCDAIHRLPYVWEKYVKKPFFFQLDLPRVFEGGALNYFKKEVIRFKGALEQFSGNKITDDKLTNSIKIYNKTRSLLKRIYELRKADEPSISGTDSVKIVQAAMTLEREPYNELLIELKDKLEKNSHGLKKGPRILFTGSI